MEALACHPLGQQGSRDTGCKVQKANSFQDTIKVRMQLSRRKRAPGVTNSKTCGPHESLTSETDKAKRIFRDWAEYREERNIFWSLQRPWGRNERDCPEDGDPLYVVRMVQAVVGG